MHDQLGSAMRDDALDAGEMRRVVLGRGWGCTAPILGGAPSTRRRACRRVAPSRRRRARERTGRRIRRSRLEGVDGDVVVEPSLGLAGTRPHAKNDIALVFAVVESTCGTWPLLMSEARTVPNRSAALLLGRAAKRLLKVWLYERVLPVLTEHPRNAVNCVVPISTSIEMQRFREAYLKRRRFVELPRQAG